MFYIFVAEILNMTDLPINWNRILKIENADLLHRKFFFSESQLSPIVKSNLVEITRIPV